MATGKVAALRRGMVAPDFALPGTDGRTWSYADVAGPKARW